MRKGGFVGLSLEGMYLKVVLSAPAPGESMEALQGRAKAAQCAWTALRLYLAVSVDLVTPILIARQLLGFSFYPSPVAEATPAAPAPPVPAAADTTGPDILPSPSTPAAAAAVTMLPQGPAKPLPQEAAAAHVQDDTKAAVDNSSSSTNSPLPPSKQQQRQLSPLRTADGTVAAPAGPADAAPAPPPSGPPPTLLRVVSSPRHTAKAEAVVHSGAVVVSADQRATTEFQRRQQLLSILGPRAGSGGGGGSMARRRGATSHRHSGRVHPAMLFHQVSTRHREERDAAAAAAMGRERSRAARRSVSPSKRNGASFSGVAPRYQDSHPPLGFSSRVSMTLAAGVATPLQEQQEPSGAATGAALLQTPSPTPRHNYDQQQGHKAASHTVVSASSISSGRTRSVSPARRSSAAGPQAVSHDGSQHTTGAVERSSASEAAAVVLCEMVPLRLSLSSLKYAFEGARPTTTETTLTAARHHLEEYCVAEARVPATGSGGFLPAQHRPSLKAYLTPVHRPAASQQSSSFNTAGTNATDGGAAVERSSASSSLLMRPTHDNLFAEPDVTPPGAEVSRQLEAEASLAATAPRHTPASTARAAASIYSAPLSGASASSRAKVRSPSPTISTGGSAGRVAPSRSSTAGGAAPAGSVASLALPLVGDECRPAAASVASYSAQPGY